MSSREVVSKPIAPPVAPTVRGEVIRPGTSTLEIAERPLTGFLEPSPGAAPSSGSFKRRRVVTKTTTERVVVEDEQDAPTPAFVSSEQFIEKTCRQAFALLLALMAGIGGCLGLIALVEGKTPGVILCFVLAVLSGWTAKQIWSYEHG
ncbi:MAG: hypothetical protein ACR2Q4_14455 [Geminicoccaceae bacterium]